MIVKYVEKDNEGGYDFLIRLIKEPAPMVRKSPLLPVLAFLAFFTTPQAPSHADFFGKAKSFLGSSENKDGGAANLATDEIIAGLREALKVGAERVVETVGRADGFNKSPDIHIPLPEDLAMVQSALGAIGLGALGEELELKLNRAAEAAAPKAKAIFWDAIASMTLEDARKILDGPTDAATQYFRNAMSAPLKAEMRPVVDMTLDQVGALRAYDRMMSAYANLPFVPDVKADLANYALDKALDGIFLYLSREEAAIRQNPAQRTTELLKKVFGGP